MPISSFPARHERCPVNIFRTDALWLESAAVDQCNTVASLPGMRRVAGMPDLHPGGNSPVGAAMLADTIWPTLVGSDIGCGIAAYAFEIKKRAFQRLADRWPALDQPDATRVGQLGTLGRGNHFVELAEVTDAPGPATAALGLGRGDLVLVVHAGSRNLGQQILDAHLADNGPGPAPSLASYLAAHDRAVAWARSNRQALAERVAAATGAGLRPLLDITHNHVEAADGGWLHRKGAAPGHGFVVVAGSRGVGSWIVQAHAGEQALWSIAHGAGRKLSREKTRGVASARHSVEQLRRPPGNIVLCDDRQLLLEEAPAGYKNLDQVIDALTSHGLATPLCRLAPRITFKSSATDPGRGRWAR